MAEHPQKENQMTTLNDSRPLTPGQARCAKAWSMVLTPSTNKRHFAFTGQQIAEASGVSLRTVTSMREFLQAFRERGLTPSGVWPQDRDRAALMLDDRPSRSVPKRQEMPLGHLQKHTRKFIKRLRA